MNRQLMLMFKNRGYSDDFYDSISRCDHPEPRNIDVMCSALKEYYDRKDRIVLLTDFDMDGIMSGVIGFAGLAEMGFNVSLAMPTVSSGYGITKDEIDNIKTRYPDANVIMTGDVGITAFESISYAREIGFDVLLTDHHMPKSVAPEANVIVDPKYPDDPAYGGICGAHVMYLVMKHYAEHFTDDPVYYVNQMDRLKVFAGFGTVTDNMPVFYENRPLLMDSLAICRYAYGSGDDTSVNEIPGHSDDIYRRAFRGLYIMLKAFAEQKRMNMDHLDEDFFGFYAGPVFNSIKRMNADISLAYKVFFGSREEAEESMNTLIALNEERKKLVNDLYDQMMNTPQPWAPFVYVIDDKPGVCGLLAQKVRMTTGLPALVLVDGDKGYHGSGRSPEWYPFLKYAGNHSDWSPAGHENAFGIFLADERCIDSYVEFIKKDIYDKMPVGAMEPPKPDFTISTLGDGDTEIDVDLFMEFLEEIEMCRPFGSGFPKPDIELKFKPKECYWTLMGSDKNHVRVTLPRGLTLVCFNQGDMFGGTIDPSNMPEVISVRGSLALNVFMGQTSVQFMGVLPQECAYKAEGDICVDGDEC